MPFPMPLSRQMAAPLSYGAAAQGRAAPAPSSFCLDGAGLGSTMGVVVVQWDPWRHRWDPVVVRGAGLWYEAGMQARARLRGGVLLLLCGFFITSWVLHHAPVSSPALLSPGAQQLRCHLWGWQRGSWRWWICAGCLWWLPQLWTGQGKCFGVAFQAMMFSK